MKDNTDQGIVADTDVPAISLPQPSPADVPAADTERAAIIRGFRELADFLEAHPEVPHPAYTTCNAFVKTREDLARVARIGSWKKGSNALFFWLHRTFAGDPEFPTLSLELNVDREKVCRRVVVGTEVIPAQPARTVEKVEWVCDEALLSGAQS